MQCLWYHTNQCWSDHIKLYQTCKRYSYFFNVKINLSTYGQLANTLSFNHQLFYISLPLAFT